MRIETQRLVLRSWLESDLEPFIRMNSDSEVMRFFPNTLEPAQTEQFYNNILQEFSEYGYGLYATEEKESGNFIGFIGFHWAIFDVAFCPCIEIGWRLDKKYWGRGYATEGAKACLEHGFTNLNFDEIYSFTGIINLPSQRVMQKIGMQFEQYFEHPKVSEGNPLRPHVCYRIKNSKEGQSPNIKNHLMQRT
jgi:Acetyltransferases, including N-acetylases of ribosomal proteins